MGAGPLGPTMKWYRRRRWAQGPQIIWNPSVLKSSRLFVLLGLSVIYRFQIIPRVVSWDSAPTNWWGRGARGRPAKGNPAAAGHTGAHKGTLERAHRANREENSRGTPGRKKSHSPPNPNRKSHTQMQISRFAPPHTHTHTHLSTFPAQGTHTP